MVLPPLPVAVPLLSAALLAAIGEWLPRRVNELLAISAATATAVLCFLLLGRAVHGPIIYWFGGWTPRAGVSLGIDFAVDAAGAGLASLSALLAVAALVYSVHYFDSARATFHVLLLSFLAALCGFSLTGDLFNLFVFFELMSAAAFALAGYKSEEPSALQGAFNFGVSNTIGAFLVLIGIALLYGRTGALNLAQIGRSLGPRADGLVLVAFALISCGFLVKAALIPFHFWLADAHAVAPTPICILFSGVMVEAGLYAVARVYGATFAPLLTAHAEGLRHLLLAAGAATSVVGAVMAFAQRHLKRLLAFSTISHMGTMTAGIAVLDPIGWTGTVTYVAGHALVKAALFLCAGILLHRLRSVDEVALRGRGKTVPLLGVLWALAGLALSGLPPFLLFRGEALVDHALESAGRGWIAWLLTACAAVTAGAVLRAAGRIWMGWGRGPEAADTAQGETTEQPETEPPHGLIAVTMWVPAAALLALALALGFIAQFERGAAIGAAHMLNPAVYADLVLDGKRGALAIPELPGLGAKALVHGFAAAVLALIVAAVALFRDRLPAGLLGLAASVAKPPLELLRRLHSGAVGDYVAWLVAGVAAFGGACAAWLR